MSEPIKHMASAHSVTWGHLVMGIARRHGEWWLLGAAGEAGPFDAVVLAIPAEQAAAFVALHDFGMTRAAMMVRSQPCWTSMFVFDRPLDGLPSVIRDVGDIAWAARNSAKPGRPEPEAWVVQANAVWSGGRLDALPEQISELLLAALSDAARSLLPQPIAAHSHRWRYALSAGTGDGALWNSELRLGVCGDWLLGPSIECAWLSGRMLAQDRIGPDWAPERQSPEGQSPKPAQKFICNPIIVSRNKGNQMT